MRPRLGVGRGAGGARHWGGGQRGEYGSGAWSRYEQAMGGIDAHALPVAQQLVAAYDAARRRAERLHAVLLRLQGRLRERDAHQFVVGFEQLLDEVSWTVC